ncbi:MAG: glycosyltransferase family 39 protein [Chloroflexota bacterium]
MGRLRASERLTLQVPWTGVALAAILVFGVGMLYYRLADVPREMTSDHAEKLLDVRDVLDGQHRIFFPRNTGREAMQFYLIAVMTPLAGLSYLTMKLGTALVAAFTLPFTFLLTRVFFGTGLALLATAILAMTRWLWQVARVGLRFPFPPAFGAAIIYFLLKAIRDRRRNDFLLCGLALGLAQHTYTSLRLAPLAVVACIGIALLVDVWRREPPGRVHRLIGDSVLLFAISGLVFMPLARYAVDDPDSFLFRGMTRLASDNLSEPPPNLLAVFLGNVKNAFLMFNWRGDVVWVNTIPGERMLDPISGALFVLGSVYALYRIVRHRELPYVYLFVLLFVGLLPSIMSLAYPGENPSTVRSGMAIPVVVVFVALPAMLLARRLGAWIGGREGQVAAGLALAALLIAVFRINFDQYFRIYPRQHAMASQHTAEVARVVNGFIAMGGRREDVYILPGAHWFDTRLVAIQAGNIRWQPLLPNVEDARKQDGVPRERLYLVHPDDTASLDKLARWYPAAIRHVHTLEDTGGRPWFVTVQVPPGATAAG